MSRPDMATLRRREQTAAAAEVGVTDLTFLGYPDGLVTPSFELRRDLSRVIRQFRPGRVLTSSPERDWRRLGASHPDHLAVGEAATCAVYPDARNPFAHPELLAEGLEPHTVPELWLFAGPRSDVVVDTTAAFDRKVAALLSHRSQIADPDAVTDRVREWGTGTATEAGMDPGAVAETFQRVLDRLTAVGVRAGPLTGALPSERDRLADAGPRSGETSCSDGSVPRSSPIPGGSSGSGWSARRWCSASQPTSPPTPPTTTRRSCRPPTSRSRPPTWPAPTSPRRRVPRACWRSRGPTAASCRPPTRPRWPGWPPRSPRTRSLRCPPR